MSRERNRACVAAHLAAERSLIWTPPSSTPRHSRRSRAGAAPSWMLGIGAGALSRRGANHRADARLPDAPARVAEHILTVPTTCR
jgi:hypothetical protein